jgi:hypothetical protein
LAPTSSTSSVPCTMSSSSPLLSSLFLNKPLRLACAVNERRRRQVDPNSWLPFIRVWLPSPHGGGGGGGAAWHGWPLASPATASSARQGRKPKVEAPRHRCDLWPMWARIVGLILSVVGLLDSRRLGTPPAHQF